MKIGECPDCVRVIAYLRGKHPWEVVIRSAAQDHSLCHDWHDEHKSGTCPHCKKKQ